jgi:hypothetical protein
LTSLPQERQDHNFPIPSELDTWDIISSILVSNPEKKPQHEKVLQECLSGERAVNELRRCILVHLHVRHQTVPVFVSYFAVGTFYSSSVHVRLHVARTFAFLKPTFSALNTLPQKLTICTLDANHARIDLIIQL